MSDTITIVAKGPSASNAQEFINVCAGTHIAAINDAGHLFKSHINWLFFSDVYVVRDNLEVFDDRTDVFVSPTLPPGEGIHAEPAWIAKREWIQYPDNTCSGDPFSLGSKIISGGITHHCTVNGALHWLCKHGKYRKVRIIGVDGGQGYAKGVFPGSIQGTKRLTESHGTKDFLDIWRVVTEQLVQVLKCVYAVEVEWYGDEH